MDGISVEKYFSAPTAIENRFALKLMGPLKGKRILDLGCGFGESSICFALKGAEVFALDISAKMLGCVKILAEKYELGKFIIPIKAPAERIPLESESVDIVFGGNVAHHIDIPVVSKEIKRVLKKGGRAIFIEPLTYNPLINIYRKIAKDVRTKMERPFTFKDIQTFGTSFSRVCHHEFQLFTTMIFVWFFFVERLDPNEVRYWKRYIERGEDYATAFKILHKIDDVVLRIPFLRRFCWNTVIELIK